MRKCPQRISRTGQPVLLRCAFAISALACPLLAIGCTSPASHAPESALQPDTRPSGAHSNTATLWCVVSIKPEGVTDPGAEFLVRATSQEASWHIGCQELARHSYRIGTHPEDRKTAESILDSLDEITDHDRPVVTLSDNLREVIIIERTFTGEPSRTDMEWLTRLPGRKGSYILHLFAPYRDEGVMILFGDSGLVMNDLYTLHHDAIFVADAGHLLDILPEHSLRPPLAPSLGDENLWLSPRSPAVSPSQPLMSGFPDAPEYEWAKEIRNRREDWRSILKEHR